MSPTLNLNLDRVRYCAVALALFALAGLSGTDASAEGLNGRRFIASLSVHDSGHVIVEYTEPGAAVDACANPQFKSNVLLHKDNPRFKEMYALLLAAFHTKSPVNGWVNGCVDLWGNGANFFPRMITISAVQ